MQISKLKMALASLAAVLGLNGCEDREIGMQIVQMQIDGRCNSRVSAGLGRGVVDLALTSEYTIFPVVVNNLLNVLEVNSFNRTDARIDTHSIVLKQAVVRFTGKEIGGVTLPTQRIALAGTIGLDNESTVSLTVFPAKLIEVLRNSPFFSKRVGDSFAPVRSDVVVEMRIVLKGETLDGNKMNSNEFVFPVRVCNGCRVLYPAAASDASAPIQPNCLNTTLGDNDEFASGDRDTCQTPGTDNNFVDCRECPGFAPNAISRLVCQPPLQ